MNLRGANTKERKNLQKISHQLNYFGSDEKLNDLNGEVQ